MLWSLIKLDRVKVHGAFHFITKPILDDALDKLDDFWDILAHPGENVWAEDLRVFLVGKYDTKNNKE
jgi:hypothetical protein